MLENSFKFKILNYWRNIDKKILLSFLFLFFLGLFFSFSSTSSLAGERLNKDYYFFFSKHLSYTILALLIMFFISAIDTMLLKKLIIPLFTISFIISLIRVATFVIFAFLIERIYFKIYPIVFLI